MNNPKQQSRELALRSLIKANPPSSTEKRLFQFSRLHGHRARAVLFTRGIFALCTILAAGLLELHLFRTFTIHFTWVYFGLHVIAHFAALQIESKRIRRIAKIQGINPRTVARVLLQMEGTIK